MKEIILPGDLIAETPIRNSNTYVEDGKTYSMVLGMYEKEPLSIVPLEGVWVPRIEDTVVGIIQSVRNGVYEVDLKSDSSTSTGPGRLKFPGTHHNGFMGEGKNYDRQGR